MYRVLCVLALVICCACGEAVGDAAESPKSPATTGIQWKRAEAPACELVRQLRGVPSSVNDAAKKALEDASTVIGAAKQMEELTKHADAAALGVGEATSVSAKALKAAAKADALAKLAAAHSSTALRAAEDALKNAEEIGQRAGNAASGCTGSAKDATSLTLEAALDAAIDVAGVKRDNIDSSAESTPVGKKQVETIVEQGTKIIENLIFWGRGGSNASTSKMDSGDDETSLTEATESQTSHHRDILENVLRGTQSPDDGIHPSFPLPLSLLLSAVHMLCAFVL